MSLRHFLNMKKNRSEGNYTYDPLNYRLISDSLIHFKILSKKSNQRNISNNFANKLSICSFNNYFNATINTLRIFSLIILVC